ncbi:TatD family hydrolase [Candidatus Peregrinibacteria bacterium]|nr:TatD family hydrolase [Candidatus Peregrinibacteria bacterium]
MFIDTHSHLDFPEFKADIEQVIKRAQNAGVGKIINVACDLKTCETASGLSRKYDFIYSTLGLHPYESRFVTPELMNNFFEQVEADAKGGAAKDGEAASGRKIVAIGECGLDYFKAKIPYEEQIRAFQLQLELAQRAGLPVIIHSRNSEADVLEILKEFSDVRFVFHCYGGNIENAGKILDAGGMISFTGVITYPKAENIRDTAKYVPLDRIMSETDCPYLAPQKYRGKRNEPAYVVEVVKEISRVKNLPLEKTESALQKNAEEFFGI